MLLRWRNVLEPDLGWVTWCRILFEHAFISKGKQWNKSKFPQTGGVGLVPDHPDSKRIKTCNSSAPPFLHLKTGDFSCTCGWLGTYTRLPSCAFEGRKPMPQTPLQLGWRHVAWFPPVYCPHLGLRCGSEQCKRWPLAGRLESTKAEVLDPLGNREGTLHIQSQTPLLAVGKCQQELPVRRGLQWVKAFLGSVDPRVAQHCSESK